MKRVVLIHYVILISIILFSCKKDFIKNDMDKLENKMKVEKYVNAKNWSFEQKIVYSKKHLLSISKIISELWKQKSFKKLIVQNIIDNKFRKNNHEILIEDIIDILKNSENKIKFTNHQMEQLQKGVLAFKRIDNGKDVLPQLYLFNFDKVYKSLKNNQKTSTDNTVIILGIEDNKEEYPGYVEDQNGDLVQLPDLINEQEARQITNLLIINFNESDYALNQVGNTPPSDQTFPYQWYKLKLKRLALNGHKDSYARGGDEVRFKAVAVHHTYGYNPSNPSDLGYYYTDILGTTTNVSGCFVRDFTRYEINHEMVFTVNKVYDNSFINASDCYFGQYPNNPPDFIPSDMYPDYCNHQYAFAEDQILIILFEYDGWPYSSVYYRSLDPLAEEINVHKNIGNKEELKFRSAPGGVYSAMWVHNVPYTIHNDAYTGILNLDNTDENFINLSCISVLDHDAISPYNP